MPNDIDELTPIMGADEVQYAQKLSRDRLRPPVAIPGFEQREFLGRGSFGEVWKAVDSNNGRLVAIKYFTRGGSIDWSHMAREVEKLRYLFSDRYVVQLFDVGWDSDPPYYIMEYMERGSLEDLLRGGPLSVAESLRIIREVAQGLMHAHDRGILHCDLKPANIMLDQDGQPRLADFGQARLRHDQTPSLGTLFYMAPEQADLKATPDARWDVYALGVILYRMMTGELPYRLQATETAKWRSGTVEERLTGYREFILKAAKPTAHRKVPGVDNALTEIIDRCLRTNAKHRYHNVQAVLSDLDQRVAHLAKRPLLIMGGLAPIAVAIVLAVVAAIVFGRSISMASTELLNRTKESNSFAAEAVASRLALEVDKRWRILEHESNRPELKKWLTQEVPGAVPPSDSPFHQWIAAQHQLWNNQFGVMGKAAYWFVLDRQGRLQTISPLEKQLLGNYFGYRDYFHGQGKELSKSDAPPLPIGRVYRSAVYRSQPENVLAVAFSVPIRSDSSDGGEVIGVLVMETILSHISEFHGNRKQAAVLVDLRPDQAGKPGLIVDHPSFTTGAQTGVPIANVYLDEAMQHRVAEIHAAHLTRAERSQEGAAEPAASGSLVESWQESIVDQYDDPVTVAAENDYYAAVEPVFVVRGNAPRYDTGWSVLIQERRVETLAPIARIWSIFVRGGAMGAFLVITLLASLWAFVTLVVNRSGKSVFRKWGPSPESGLSSRSSTSGSASSGSSHGSLP